MSNLLKSKFFLGVVMMAVMFVGAFALSNRASAQTTVVLANEFTYSGVMKVGMSGPGISTLQAALNSVNTGVSTIIVDGKFGPATKLAVQRFQMTHGLVADGVVGPMTGEALKNATRSLIVVPSGSLPAGCTTSSGFSTVNGASCSVIVTFPAGCVSSSGFSSTTGARCDGGGTNNLPAGCSTTSGFSSTSGVRCDGGTSPSTGNNNNLSGGETSINNVQVSDADDDSINEGANKTPVAQIEFDVDDADATLVRADITFQSEDNQVGTGAGEEEDPWRVFDNVYLMDGNRVVASVRSDDEDAWDTDVDTLSGNADAEANSIRFNNIDEDFQEGDNASLWVAVDVASSVDGADSGDANWVVGIDRDGLRFTDGAGLDSVVDAGTGTGADTAEFSIEEAGAQSDFSLREASNSPDSTTFEAKETTTTTNTIAIFEAEADEDGGDIKINDFPVTLTIANAGAGNFLADVVDDVFVTLDGTEYSADQAPSTTLLTQEFTFDDIDDDDVIIAAGDQMDISVRVKIHSQGSTAPLNFDNGTTIVATAHLTDNDVEDADTGDDIDDGVNESASGETMTLAGTGISLDPVSTNASVTLVDLADNDLGVFTIKADITAFGEDAFVSQNGNLAYTARIEDASTGATLTPTSLSTVISSTADTDSNNTFRIDEGSTETFTFTITANPDPADEGKSIRAQLLTVKSGTAAATPTTNTFTISGDSLVDYRTTGVVVPD